MPASADACLTVSLATLEKVAAVPEPNQQELERAAGMLRDYGKPVVILPGNHDPLTPDSVYRRGGLGEISNVSILGLNAGKAVLFPEFELEIWGHAHLDYTDMSPLANPRPRTTRCCARWVSSTSAAAISRRRRRSSWRY